MDNQIIKTIVLFDDLSGRMAARLTQTAFQYSKNSVFIQKHEDNNRRVSAKSLLGVLSLGAKKGEKIDILISTENGNASDILAHFITVVGGGE